MEHDGENEHEHYDAGGDSEWACGGDGDCESIEREPDCSHGKGHRWTSEDMGGCDENPGVWSTGGTTFLEKSQCARCGIVRTEVAYGSQRNPGECDSVTYESH